MIQYKRIAAGLYTDQKISSFGIQPPHPTTFLIWLLTGPTLGVIPGCASMGRYGMAEQSGWSPDEIDEMIKPLISSGIVQFDPKAPFIWMPNAIKYNQPRSPLNVTSWQSDWRKLPNCFLKERAWHVFRAHCEYRDRDAVFDKKKPKKASTSFSIAFKAIERPPETPIVYEANEKLSSELSSEHRSTKQVELNRNRNRNRNSYKSPENQDCNSAPCKIASIPCPNSGVKQ